MSYLKFDKKLMINLEYSLYRNVLRTNRRGAYQNTSISGCNTTKYQGLLVMPVPFLDNDNHVILSSFDETVIQHGAPFNLGLHRYAGGTYSPNGHKYIREFNCDGIPKTIYRVGGVVLQKEIMFSSRENRLMIRYTLLDAHSPTTIRFKPFLAFRKVSELTRANDQVDRSIREVENGISTCMYYGYPELFMQFNKPVEFIYHPDWYKNVEYIQDLQAGDSFQEDLYVPGYFETTISKGEEILFSAGDIKVDTSLLADEFNNEIHIRTPRSNFYNCLKNSSHQFYYIPQKDKCYLLAGYPWFKVRARDQFISLPGCTLATNRPEDFERIMDTALPDLEAFMNDTLQGSIITQIDDPDVLLWVIWAFQKYAHEQPEKFMAKYAQHVLDIVSYILDNKHPNLIVDDKLGLVSTSGQDIAVSWMNATKDGYPVIPRSGFLVEFNALWYNALVFAQHTASQMGNKEFAQMLQPKILKTQVSFVHTFYNTAGYLFDYVDGYTKSWSVRPNMLIAIAMEYSPLEKIQKKSILDYVTKELLTNCGIRSLSPKGNEYHPRYQGSIDEKQEAYFNGVSFPWLLGSYIEAYIRVFGQSGLSLADRVMVQLEDEMQNDCIGTLSELYDSHAPFIAHGGYSFAMSVAEVLRAKQIIASHE